MSAISTLAVLDGGGNSRTFEVVTAQAGNDTPARWVYKKGSIYAGYCQLTQLVRRTTNKSAKVQVKLTLPALSTDGTNSVIHTAIATVDLTIPDTMTSTDKIDLSRFLANVLDNTIVRDALENQSPAY